MVEVGRDTIWKESVGSIIVSVSFIFFKLKNNESVFVGLVLNQLQFCVFHFHVPRCHLLHHPIYIPVLLICGVRVRIYIYVLLCC